LFLLALIALHRLTRARRPLIVIPVAPLVVVVPEGKELRVSRPAGDAHRRRRHRDLSGDQENSARKPAERRLAAP
jgi:hypothetical protein